MVAGVIRLTAYGREDMYLSYNAEVTFFKSVYKRHTFFATETIDQSFVSAPSFGSRYTCIISPHGDVLLDVLLRVTLPAIPPLPDGVQCRWVDGVACALIKKVELEINSVVVDSITGEWIRLYLELNAHKKSSANVGGSHHRGLMKMIGSPTDRPFAYTQEEQTLYVPLPFWFCRSPGQCLPVGAINNREVRINVEFESLPNLLQYGPTAAIAIQEASVHFQPGDLLYQGLGNAVVSKGSDANAIGVFVGFDPDTRTLLYNPVLGSFSSVADKDTVAVFLSPHVHLIQDLKGAFCTPKDAPQDIGPDLAWFLQERFSMGKTVVEAQYAFLGSMEKRYFAERRHEYIVEQLQIYSVTGVGTKSKIQLTVRRPCKELVWVANLAKASRAMGLPFNYTDLPDGSGRPLLVKAELLLNADSVFDDTTGHFFRELQLMLHHSPSAVARLPGIQVYSFGLRPDDLQPSGTVNFSKIDRCFLNLQVSSFVNDTVDMRIFARTYNVLVIHKGVATLLF